MLREYLRRIPPSKRYSPFNFIQSLREDAAVFCGRYTLSWYENLINLLSSDDTKYFGDLTATYSILPPPKLAAIKQHFPGTRILIPLRDPVIRAISQFRMSSPHLLDPHNRPALEEFLQSQAFGSQYSYKSITEKFLGTFGSNCLVFRFSGTFDNRHMQMISEFLNLDEPLPTPQPGANRSQAKRNHEKMVAFDLIREAVRDSTEFWENLPDEWQWRTLS